MALRVQARYRRSFFDVAHEHTASGCLILRTNSFELLRGHDFGEGVGKVVYASQHWVVKRDRSPSEVVAIIVLWNFLRKLKRVLPGGWVDALLRGPSKEIHLLRVLVQAAMMVVPKSVWFTRHIRKAWTVYISRDRRGRRLAEQHLKVTA